MTKYIKILIIIVSISLWSNVSFSREFLFQSREKYKRIKVTRVLKTDLIILENDEKIRLIGLKAPDAPKIIREDKDYDKFGFVIKKDDPIEPLEVTAFEFARDLLEDQYVRIEFDNQIKDDSFHTYGYVFKVEDDLFVNAEILRFGYASLQIRPPNLKYSDTLREAYKEARREKMGLQNE